MLRWRFWNESAKDVTPVVDRIGEPIVRSAKGATKGMISSQALLAQVRMADEITTCCPFTNLSRSAEGEAVSAETQWRILVARGPDCYRSLGQSPENRR